MHLLIRAAETVTTFGDEAKNLVQQIITAVTTAVPMSAIIGIIAAIIAGGLGFMVIWKFGRKGFSAIVSALTGGRLKF